MPQYFIQIAYTSELLARLSASPQDRLAEVSNTVEGLAAFGLVRISSRMWFRISCANGCAFAM